MKKNIFEDSYQKYGNKAQRTYPNTELISFIKTKFTQNSIKKKIKALEVGSGTGANLWMLAQEKFITHGLDNSKSAIKICKKNLKKRKLHAELHHGSMTNLKFKKNFFNLIIDVVSMQNIPYSDHQKSWKSIFSCIKPGGYFFSYHLGQQSTSFKELKKDKKRLIDKSTLKNVPKKYPLSHKGSVCFLKSSQVFLELNKIGFKKINIEKVTRSYSAEEHKIEYLIITAKK